MIMCVFVRACVCMQCVGGWGLSSIYRNIEAIDIIIIVQSFGYTVQN